MGYGPMNLQSDENSVCKSADVLLPSFYTPNHCVEGEFTTFVYPYQTMYCLALMFGAQVDKTSL
jgi:hypothetical protein